MTQFASIALLPLVAAMWVSSPPAQIKESVIETRGDDQVTKDSYYYSFTGNIRLPHFDLNMSFISPIAPEILLEFDTEGAPLLPGASFCAGIEDASTNDSVQYNGVSLPPLLRRAVMACEHLLTYYREHLTLMNLDAVMGTRIAEGQFHLGLADLAVGGESTIQENVNVECVAAELRRLHVGAGLVSDAGEARVRKDNPRQYENLSALLQKKFWEVTLVVPPFPQPASHNSGFVLKGLEQLNGRQTDACLKQVASGRGCAVTRGCWELMTSRICSGYSLTHQVLFLIAGVQAGCKVYLDSLAAREGIEGGVSVLLARLCSVVLSEAKEISQAGFPEHRRDLFMEQGALCGVLGYRSFFQEAWVARVLSWQLKVGCYGGSDHHYLATLQRPTSLFDSLHTRVRRGEQVMTGECLAHRSAVALGYLAVFTRQVSVDTLANSE